MVSSPVESGSTGVTRIVSGDTMRYSDTWRALREQRAHRRDVESRGVQALVEPYTDARIPEQRRPPESPRPASAEPDFE
jgi:hypothetical protein